MAFLVANAFLCALIISSFCHTSGSVEDAIFHRFLKFIDDFNRKYENGTREFERRFENFKINLERIERLNEGYSGDGHSPVFGVNKFSDLSQEEFTAQYLSDPRPQRKSGSTVLKFRPEGPSSMSGWNKTGLLDLPQKVDWREAGVVSPVKNQAQCGACWAFAATEVVESAYAIAHNSSAPKLAVQQLIDCAAKNYGCKGGDICVALEYIQSAGVTYEANYPLTDKDGTCHPLSPKDKVVKVAEVTCTKYVGTEDSVLQMLASSGPVSVAVDATTWNNYIGGIIQFHCGTTINHAVDIVGYDLTGPVPYYIVRNSWGPDFGLAGYMHIKVGGNICGIAEEVSSVSIS